MQEVSVALDKRPGPVRFWRVMQHRARALALTLFTTGCFLVGSPGAEVTASATPESAAPLYLLTYDHGGLVLWGHEHFAERLREAVSWLDKYPGFKIGLDNEAHTYDVLAEQNPKLLGEIRGYLKRYPGRFGIGTCTYGQPLSTFINEESNVRQLIEAIRTNQRHFGYTPVVYLMSEHAMHSQIPQLLAGCGFQAAIMRTHFMMYGYNPTFDAAIGWWVGLDGSRIPAVPTYPGEGAAFGKTTVDNWVLTRWPGKDTPKSLADFRRDFAHIQPLLASRADDSGLRREALVQECESKTQYHWLLLDELLRTFPKPETDFKTEPNDFVTRMPWGYCGNEIWNTSRLAEVQVLTAERLAALEFLAGGSASRERDLETAWKNLLVAQHHDIQICGLLAEARRFLPASLAASGRVRDAAMQFFASGMKGEGLLQLTAFNPSSWKRREWLQTELSFPEKGQAKQILVEHGGKTTPAVLLSAERYSDGSLMSARVAFPAELDGLALAAYSLKAAKTNLFAEDAVSEALVRITTNANATAITTPFHEATLHSDGGLASLVDRKTGKQLLKPGFRSMCFAATIDGQQNQSKGRWSLPATRGDAPLLTAREDGFIGSIPYTFELTFHSETARLDGRVNFHISGQKLGRVSDNQRDALPFAIAETTNRYVEGNYWTAVGDGVTGLAVFNRGAMGSVRETDGSFSVPLAFAMYYIWGTRMLDGDFAYEFSLYPFAGEWRRQKLHERALEYNLPFVAVSGLPGTGRMGDEVGLVEAGSEQVILSALYPERGRVLARLYECQGRGGEAKLALRGRPARIVTTDLLSGHATPADATLRFRPWQIRTLQIMR